MIGCQEWGVVAAATAFSYFYVKNIDSGPTPQSQDVWAPPCTLPFDCGGSLSCSIVNVFTCVCCKDRVCVSEMFGATSSSADQGESCRCIFWRLIKSTRNTVFAVEPFDIRWKTVTLYATLHRSRLFNCSVN